MYISLMRSSVSDPTPKAQETRGKGKTGKVRAGGGKGVLQKTSFGYDTDIILINLLLL